jgi:hypothetical protein
VLAVLTFPIAANAQTIGDATADAVAGAAGGAIIGGMNDDVFLKGRPLLRPSFRYSEDRHCRPVPIDALGRPSLCWEWSHFSL